MMSGLPARSFVNDDAVLSSSKRVSGRSGAAAARADMALAVLKAVVSGRFTAWRLHGWQLLMRGRYEQRVAVQMQLYALIWGAEFEKQALE